MMFNVCNFKTGIWKPSTGDMLSHLLLAEKERELRQLQDMQDGRNVQFRNPAHLAVFQLLTVNVYLSKPVY